MILILIQGILLCVKRTSATKSRCNYPDCSRARELKTIPKNTRHAIAVQEKIFIPAGVPACPAHINFDSWKDANGLIEPNENEFSREYLEEMFRLLTTSSTNISGCKESRT